MFGKMRDKLQSSIFNFLVPSALALVMGIGVMGLTAQEVEEPLPMPMPAESQTISVELSESEITLPEEIQAGMVIFEVKNNGESEHGFAIEGQGIEAKVDGTIPPGESKNLEVNLTAGSYRVFCPEQPDLTKDITVVGGEGN